MSFDNIQSEPKKTYLNNLINLYYQTGTNLIQYSNYTDGLKGIRTLLLIIPKRPADEVTKLREKVKQYMNGTPTNSEDLYNLFEETGALLNEYYFSELHLGIVPTSTLAGDKPPPKHEPIPEHVSSKL